MMDLCEQGPIKAGMSGPPQSAATLDVMKCLRHEGCQLKKLLSMKMLPVAGKFLLSFFFFHSAVIKLN